MNRPLCYCFASVALLLPLGSTRAQVLVGQSRLAPVALEARCLIADDLLGPWSYANPAGPSVAPVLESEKTGYPFEAMDIPAVAESAPAEMGASTSTEGLAATSGSSPVIVLLLQEEYRPYDLVLPHVVKIDFVAFEAPQAFSLATRQSVIDDQTLLIHQEAVDNDAEVAATCEADDDMPSVELPIAAICYLEMVFGYADRLFDPQGDLGSRVQPRNLGTSLVQATSMTLRQLAMWSIPALPTLIQPIGTTDPGQVNPNGQAAPRNIAPAAPQVAEELGVAGLMLHWTAGELERLAGALRTAGDSMLRTAQVDRGSFRH